MPWAGTGWVPLQRWRSRQEQRNWVAGHVPMECLRLRLEVTAGNTKANVPERCYTWSPRKSDPVMMMYPWAFWGGDGQKGRAQARYSFMGVTMTGQSSVHYRHRNTDWLKQTVFHESVQNWILNARQLWARTSNSSSQVLVSSTQVFQVCKHF